MKLIILNYELGCVDIIKNLPDNIENWEDFVYNTLDYKDSEISWILLEDDYSTNLYTYDKVIGKVVYDNDNFVTNA